MTFAGNARPKCFRPHTARLTAPRNRAQHTEKATVFHYSKVKMMPFQHGGGATASLYEMSRRNVMASHLPRNQPCARGGQQPREDQEIRNAK
jgi:hypothetical protein